MVEEEESSGDTSPALKEKLKKLEGEVDKPTQITRIKRLKELQDKLEGTHEIDRIKKVKKKLIIPQIVGIFILFPFLLYLNGASQDPLYFPLYYPILMLFGWILILIVESFVFRVMRIKRHRSKSTKYILAKKSMKKSLSFMVIALIIFGVIYTPFLTDSINDRLSIEDGRIDVEEADDIYKARFEFDELGVFSLSGVKNLTIRPHEHDTQIFYTLYEIGGDEQQSGVLRENDGTHFEFDNDDFRKWVIRIESDDRFSLEYEKRIELLEDKMKGFSILSFFYVGIFLQWPAILYPIRQKYTGKGIYR